MKRFYLILAVLLLIGNTHGMAQNAPESEQNAPTAPAQNAPGVGAPSVAASGVAASGVAAALAKVPVQMDVPVLITPKRINDEITAEDLTIKQFPSDKVRSDILLDSNSIIGLAARRVLNVGQPLRSIDLHKAQLVQRGELVTMIYKNGDMEISASGKAQDGGALNDVIRVVNAGSNRTVTATVTGPKEVTLKE